MHELSQALLRIEQLERTQRRLLRVGAGLATLLAIAIATPLLVGFRQVTPDVLRAESLELFDSQGQVYASIKRDHQGHPALLLRHEKSHALVTTNGPALHLRAEDGRRGVFAGFGSDGTGKVELSDENLVGRSTLRVAPDGAPSLYVSDGQGFPRAGLEHFADGSSALHLRGEQGQVRASMGVGAGGNASNLLFDLGGRRRIGMLVQPDGTPLLSMGDELTRPRINLSMDFDGAPWLEFLREDGKPSHRYP